MKHNVKCQFVVVISWIQGYSTIKIQICQFLIVCILSRNMFGLQIQAGLPNFDCIIMPLSIKNAHFIVVVFDFRLKVFFISEPLGSDQ